MPGRSIEWENVQYPDPELQTVETSNFLVVLEKTQCWLTSLTSIFIFLCLNSISVFRTNTLGCLEGFSNLKNNCCSMNCKSLSYASENSRECCMPYLQSEPRYPWRQRWEKDGEVQSSRARRRCQLTAWFWGRSPWHNSCIAWSKGYREGSCKGTNKRLSAGTPSPGTGSQIHTFPPKYCLPLL